MERHIVLVSPDVHWNTGNIGRTCLGTDSVLHLIKPLGFSLDDKHLKRAGLDYWKNVEIFLWDDFEIFLKNTNPKKEELVFFSKLGKKIYTKMPRLERLFLVFGSETKGLSSEITEKFKDNLYYIPVNKKIRSLNLSTSAGIALYESLRSESDFHEWK
ncbi:MAG: tRNA (cytidine(34)-2'-O)-methyltransferase [Desulforegulaceae bacterium]|nr:tRNA (cytidine(34)-2'-O)-methyltransferase [Desulforegulaceae bacterium]